MDLAVRSEINQHLVTRAESAFGVLAIAHARLLRSRCVAERPTPAGRSNKGGGSRSAYPERGPGAQRTLRYVTTAGLLYSPPRHLPRGGSLPAPRWAIMPQPRRAAITRAKSVRYDKTILVDNWHTRRPPPVGSGPAGAYEGG